mmetsp:Transcript_4700/g.14895  ORF Transcript_4700/g.14895 Transcript_4700/m.14895 type:complete len:252 (-) Transcript_4700:12-767(-)
MPTAATLTPSGHARAAPPAYHDPRAASVRVRPGIFVPGMTGRGTRSAMSRPTSATPAQSAAPTASTAHATALRATRACEGPSKGAWPCRTPDASSAAHTLATSDMAATDNGRDSTAVRAPNCSSSWGSANCESQRVVAGASFQFSVRRGCDGPECSSAGVVNSRGGVGEKLCAGMGEGQVGVAPASAPSTTAKDRAGEPPPSGRWASMSGDSSRRNQLRSRNEAEEETRKAGCIVPRAILQQPTYSRLLNQ